jgi:antirestriction protein ArdC
LGGNVRRGERGTTVVYADRFTPDDERQRALREGGEAQTIPFLKRLTVLNIAQCEGLPSELSAAVPPQPENLILPQPADESLINRRLCAPPPALCSLSLPDRFAAYRAAYPSRPQT